MRYRRRSLFSYLPWYIRLPISAGMLLLVLAFQGVAYLSYSSMDHESPRYESSYEEPGDDVIAATFEAHHVDGAFYPAGAEPEPEPEPVETGLDGMAVLLAGTGFTTVLVGFLGLGLALGVFSSSTEDEEAPDEELIIDWE